jgi:hypothetical protein
MLIETSTKQKSQLSTLEQEFANDTANEQLAEEIEALKANCETTNAQAMETMKSIKEITDEITELSLKQ